MKKISETITINHDAKSKDFINRKFKECMKEQFTEFKISVESHRIEITCEYYEE